MGLIRSSLIDLKNGLPPRALAEKFHPRGVVFVHVPKCAGTSFEKALRSHYRLSRVAIDPEATFSAAARTLAIPSDTDSQHEVLTRASEMRREMLHYYLSCGYKCITGHAPLGPQTIATASKTHDFVTILRDPVERYLSHLTFNTTKASGHGRIKQAVEAFLESPRAHVMGSLYVKYFSGMPMTEDFSSPGALAASKATLCNLQSVGFVDDLETFATDITRLTEHSIRIGHENKGTPENSDHSSFSTDVLEKVTRLCTADREIYRWACDKFR